MCGYLRIKTQLRDYLNDSYESIQVSITGLPWKCRRLMFTLYYRCREYVGAASVICETLGNILILWAGPRP